MGLNNIDPPEQNPSQADKEEELLRYWRELYAWLLLEGLETPQRASISLHVGHVHLGTVRIEVPASLGERSGDVITRVREQQTVERRRYEVALAELIEKRSKAGKDRAISAEEMHTLWEKTSTPVIMHVRGQRPQGVLLKDLILEPRRSRRQTSNARGLIEAEWGHLKVVILTSKDPHEIAVRRLKIEQRENPDGRVRVLVEIDGKAPTVKMVPIRDLKLPPSLGA